MHRVPFAELNSTSEQSPLQRRKKKRRTRRRRQKPKQLVVQDGSDSDSNNEENQYLHSQRQHVKTPLSKQHAQKSRTRDRRQPRGEDIFSPAKREQMVPNSPPGVLLRSAVCNKDYDGLKKMLVETPALVHDVSEIGENGSPEAGLTVLHVACQLGFDNCTELILRLCPTIDVNVRTESGSTALHYACSQGAATCVELLISAGAKIHLKNILNQTPSDVCRDSLSGDYQACQQLIEIERQRVGMVFLKMSAGVFAVTGLCYGLYYFLTTTTNDSTDGGKKDNK